MDDYKTIIVYGENWPLVFRAIFIEKKIVEVRFESLNRVRVPVAHIRPICNNHFRLYMGDVAWLEDIMEQNK